MNNNDTQRRSALASAGAAAPSDASLRNRASVSTASIPSAGSHASAVSIAALSRTATQKEAEAYIAKMEALIQEQKDAAEHWRYVLLFTFTADAPLTPLLTGSCLTRSRRATRRLMSVPSHRLLPSHSPPR